MLQIRQRSDKVAAALSRIFHGKTISMFNDQLAFSLCLAAMAAHSEIKVQ
jgi:hypothetical protein